MDINVNVWQQFYNQQQKYVYYIIALSVTAIGFSIYNTIGKPLNYVHIPLGVALLAWGISIYCGLRFMKYTISTLYSNHDYLNMISGNDEIIGNSPKLIKAASEGFKEAMKSNSKKTKILIQSQEYLFFAGIVLFLLWHILEMAQTI